MNSIVSRSEITLSAVVPSDNVMLFVSVVAQYVIRLVMFVSAAFAQLWSRFSTESCMVL